ncbi:DUF86 domain-containing protein [Halovibrio sp. HP20-50]|uniref:HepT-like ribonuclease domain-containing protein n=1 Tax=Halovibrio sp. HP20-59 TaxID=3080275 RepID=UPI00294AD4D2|nr:DUF86 domain-containing protein [Halovibrio sp. HP20-59]MEA2118218.1 DUF86 domain-containing protein [Halovibrio sp. HP20-59]
MSEPQQKREWRFYIDDMIGFSKKVLSYTAGMDQSAFLNHDLTYDATLRNLELIGEAATRVPVEVRHHYPLVPWRLVIATRNRLIHAYLGIDEDTIWSIIQENVPELLELLETIRRENPKATHSKNNPSR